jgi:hypothetical protein
MSGPYPRTLTMLVVSAVPSPSGAGTPNYEGQCMDDTSSDEVEDYADHLTDLSERLDCRMTATQAGATGRPA